MSMTVEATYEDGVLKLKQPLPLAEHEEVRVTVEPATTWAERTAGMLCWNGAPEELEHLALDPHFDPQEMSMTLLSNEAVMGAHGLMKARRR